MRIKVLGFFASLTLLGLASTASASSHREAPFVTHNPKVDGTDVYAFRSYEPGREGFVTLLANYQPLQDAYGGPNYFTMDPNALYEIHVDNNGDAREDLTFQFRFRNILKGFITKVGGESVAVPLRNLGPIGPRAEDTVNLNETEEYNLTLVRGDRRTGDSRNIGTFRKPFDNVGGKSFPTPYSDYADRHISEMEIPGCEGRGRVFVGQRQEGFFLNLGEIFDLLNFNPVGPTNSEPNTIVSKNITTLALEIPIGCLTTGGDPVIGVWSSASLRQARVLNPSADFEDPERVGGAWTQVSRLGMPLVNELVIGLPDKNRFNGSHPTDDGQFLKYVTNPTLPAIIQALFNVGAPTAFPREDLIQVFLTGVAGLNQPAAVTPGEMIRLNTSIDPKPIGQQSTLGVLGGDTAGFPNGRRVGDDSVDITLRAAMGVLLPGNVAPGGQLPINDGTPIASTDFLGRFPYLNPPVAGSPNGFN